MVNPRELWLQIFLWRLIIFVILQICIRAQEGSIAEIDHETMAYHFRTFGCGGAKLFHGISQY